MSDSPPLEDLAVPLPEESRAAKVLAHEAPATGDPWEFADDDAWTAWIDALTAEQIPELVRRGLHLPSLARVRAALREVQSLFLRRERALEMMVACAIARVNLVYLGPPGTAKSLLVRSFSEALGVRNLTRPIREEAAALADAQARRHEGPPRRLFEYLLTRYTTPEELFGGTDIQVLLQGNVYARRTAGMLPQAEVAFLDEIFKGNSAILNTLLSLTNERIFYNLGQAFRVNLAFVVGASNETPDLGELGALFDRFPIRVPCHPVPDDRVEDLLERSHRFGCAELLNTSAEQIARRACLNDLRLLTKVAAAGVYGGLTALPKGGTAELFLDLFLRTRRDYGVSDRTPALLLRVARALALVESDGPEGGHAELGVRHLRVWGYVAPQLKSLTALQRFVQQQIQAYDPAAVDIFDAS